MKNEDTKMLLKDVKYVYFQEKTAKLLFWFFLSFAITISAQTNLNNFGSLEVIRTYHGLKKIAILDYNNDGFDDLFLCGNNKKFFVLHRNIADSTFSKPIKKFFFYPIDDIKRLNKNAEGEDYYLFISHNKRLAGLVSFTKNYSLQLLSTIEFNSYPSAIRIVDLNHDGLNEALIFGNNFDGLSLVKNKMYKISTTKLIEQMVVKDLALIDFNLDNFEDVVLIDMLDNSLKFYENYAKDKIIFNREIVFGKSIQNIKNIDFNNDEFEDLMIGQENGSEILFGDSVYAFNKSEKANYDFTPKSFEIADINVDSTNKIMFFDSMNNQVIVASTDSLENITNKYIFDGLADFKILEDSTGKKLVQLSKNGNLFVISNKNQKGRNFNFTIGGKPSLIKVIDNNNKTLSLAVYDFHDKNINLLKLDSLGNFTKNRKVHLFNPISNFIVSTKGQIIAFRKESRLLEVVEKGLSVNNKNRSFIYSAKPIQTAKFENNFLFSVLGLEDGKLFRQKFSYKKNKYISQELTQIDSAVIQAEFNTPRGILYWKLTKGKLSLYNFENSKSQNLLDINIHDSLSVDVKFISKAKRDLIFTIVQFDQNTFVYSIKNNIVNKYKIKNEEITGNKINNYDFQLFFNPKTKETILFFLNKKKGKLLEFVLDEEQNIFIEKTKILVKNVGDFFIDIIFGKMYFVYTNLKNYCISFRVIE